MSFKLKLSRLSIVAITIIAMATVAFVMACGDDDPTATPVPPTATSVPPTATPVSPTPTSAPAQPSGETVKIGTLMDVTGDLGIFGPPMQLATDLAIQLVNEAGGVNGSQIELIHRDSGTSEQLATDAASALVNVEDVSAIIGSLSSGVTIAVAESVTIPAGALLVSPASSSPAVAALDDNDFVFRTAVSDALQGVIAAELASQLGFGNVATTYINNAYGEGLTTVFADNFERKGGSVSAQVGHESGQASYLSELRRASDDDAEALMTIAYPESAGVILRESVEGKFFDQYLFVDGTKSQEMFDELGVENFEGAYGTAPGAPDTPAKQTFLNLYTTRTDGNPDSLFISEAFDAAAILALAIEKADSSDSEDIRDAMREVANAPGEKVGPGDIARALQLIRDGRDIDYVGAAGDQDFDDNGDVLNTIEIWRVVDGQITSTGIFARPGDPIDIDPSSMMQQSPQNDGSGTFSIGDGSRGLFKVDETLRGVDVVVAMESSNISGSIDLDAGTANIDLNLHSLESNQERRDEYVRERLFPAQPVATVHFHALGQIPPSFYTSGEELKMTLPATVNINGVDANLDFDITARLDNSTDLVVLGTADFVWADFGMTAPVSSFFTVEDDVRAEILLIAKLVQ